MVTTTCGAKCGHHALPAIPCPRTVPGGATPCARVQASARRTDVNFGQLRAELPCAPSFSERAVAPHRNYGLRKDPPTDREAVVSALAEEVLACALPRELPLLISAHGALAPYAALAGRQAALRPRQEHTPDSALLFLNSLGLALAAAELPVRGGMLVAVRVMKRGEAGRVRCPPHAYC